MNESVAVRAENQVGGWVCEVEVAAEGETTDHRVTVAPAEVARWARGSSQSDVEDLVRRSFEFLLEREPASSILGEFDLAVVQRYFPEYDRLFRRSVS